jgi:hypothetical protein
MSRGTYRKEETLGGGEAAGRREHQILLGDGRGVFLRVLGPELHPVLFSIRNGEYDDDSVVIILETKQ